MSERKEVSQYGHTHSISLDTWKPEWEYKPKTADKPAPKQEEEISIEDIPF
jgi:hypothetical protein